MSCDFASLVLQSIGGGITATAIDNNTSNTGVHIMIAGLAFQVFSLVLFMVLCLGYAGQVRRARKEERFVERFAALRRSGAFRAFKYGE